MYRRTSYIITFHRQKLFTLMASIKNITTTTLQKISSCKKHFVKNVIVTTVVWTFKTNNLQPLFECVSITFNGVITWRPSDINDLWCVTIFRHRQSECNLCYCVSMHHSFLLHHDALFSHSRIILFSINYVKDN